MKRLRWLHALIILFVVAGGWLLVPDSASACSCAMNPEVSEAYSQSDAVFEGTVIGRKEQVKLLSRSSADPVTWTFEVHELWKGKVSPKIEVKSALWEESCGYEFQDGQRYLVYATHSGDSLNVSLCSRTVPISAAGGDLAELGQGTVPPQPNGAAAADTGSIWWIVTGFVVIAGALAVIIYKLRTRPGAKL